MAIVGLAGAGVAAVLATSLVAIVGAIAGASVKHPPPALSIAGDVAFDLGAVAAAVYIAASLGGPRSPADFGFRRVSVRTVARSVFLGALVYYVVTAIYANVVHVPKDNLPTDLGVSRSHAALVAAAIFVCVIAPIAEETFFRGFLFGTLRGWKVWIGDRDLSTWLAAAVTGVVFGAVHYGSAPALDLVPLGFLGFVLCVIRWKTGSLYPCIVLHSGNNAVALGVMQHWTAPVVVALMLATWAVTAAITLPLGLRSPRIA
jgi:membrane protease YdiL (CAAX protease family)